MLEIPDDDDARQRAKDLVLKHLDQVWPVSRRGCPVCSTKSWIISGIYQMSELQGGLLPVLSETVQTVTPTALIVCSSCGYQFMMNAIKAGVFDAQGKLRGSVE